MLSAVDPAQTAKPVAEASLHDQLRELVAPILTDSNRVILTATDLVRGGTPCSVIDCPRTQVGQNGICKVHLVHVEGWLDPEAAAYLTTVTDVWGQPGINNPADPEPIHNP